MPIINTLSQVKNKSDDYKNWRNERNQLESIKNKEGFVKNYTADELEMAESHGRTIIDTVTAMKDYTQGRDQAVDTMVDQVTSYSAAAGFLTGSLTSLLACKFIKKTTAPIIFVGATLGTIFGFSAGSIWGAKVHKDAARITRYEARTHYLSDPKNFIVYTPEQIKQAKTVANEKIKNQKVIDKNNASSEIMHSLYDTFKTFESTKYILNDNTKSSKWRQLNNELEAKRQKALDENLITKEQLAVAKSEKDVTLGIFHTIHSKESQYSENTRLAMNVIGLAGIPLGYGVGKFLEHLTKNSTTKNVIKNNVKKYAATVLPIAAGISSLLISFQIKTLAGALGEFKAKQELLKNPYNFVTYDDINKDKLEEVKNNTNNSNNENKSKSKAFFSYLAKEFKFVFNLGKDVREHHQYEKTDAIYENAVKDSLKKSNISKKQMQDARLLQSKLFRVFDKMDETKEGYVTDTEAARSIGRDIVISLFSIPAMLLASKEIAEIQGIINNKSSNTSVTKIIGQISKKALNVGKEAALFVAIPLAVYEIIATKIQKRASQIALMEGMKELDDPMNFVELNEEQKKSVNMDETVAKMDELTKSSKPSPFVNMISLLSANKVVDSLKLK